MPLPAALGLGVSGPFWARWVEERVTAKEPQFLSRSTARPPIRNLSPTLAELPQACSSRSWAAPAEPPQELIHSNKRKTRPMPSMPSGACSKKNNLLKEKLEI